MAAESGLSFGVVAFGDDAKVSTLEDLPIDSVWTGGHVASTNPSSEVLMRLSRISALTHRVAVGTSVLLLPLYPPAIVAKQVADLDQSTGGRVILGVGVGGEYPQEFRACGVALEERGRRTDEAIPLLRRLWSADEICHDGTFYPMREVRIRPAPFQPNGPPIVIAGRQDVAMRRAARLGDGWMPYLYSPPRYASSVARIRHLAVSQGRDLTGFLWYAFVFVNVDPDGDNARRAAAQTLGGTYNQDFRTRIDRVAVAGTPSEVTEKLQAFVDAGARRFIFMPAAGHKDPHGMVNRLFDDVVPLLTGTT